jgi:hypothetical protein
MIIICRTTFICLAPLSSLPVWVYWDCYRYYKREPFNHFREIFLYFCLHLVDNLKPFLESWHWQSCQCVHCSFFCTVLRSMCHWWNLWFCHNLFNSLAVLKGISYSLSLNKTSAYINLSSSVFLTVQDPGYKKLYFLDITSCNPLKLKSRLTLNSLHGGWYIPS